ncbi:MAG: helix-turn-helix transcriptional regulator [Pseudonocardiaceae bacterium]
MRRRTGLAGAHKAAGYTQEGLAAEVHVDRSTVIRWEAGDHAPLPYLRPKLARLLGQSREQLRKLAERPEDAPPWVYFHGPQRLAFQRGVAYVELGRHADAVPLLSSALESLPDCYERDRARYAAQLALALAGTGDADGALIAATRAAELAAATGSALTTRDLRRVRAAMRERGAATQARALTEHIRALADELC